MTDETPSHTGRKKGLGALNLIALGIGSSLGAGLFAITGITAGQFSGPAVSLCFIFAAIACGCVGLCYAELATMFTKVSGASYTYISTAMGECVAWLATWCLVATYIVSLSLISVSWSGYLGAFLANWHVIIPDKFLLPLGTSLPAGGMAWGVWPALFIFSVVAAILCLGTKESAGLNNFFVFLKVAVVIIFVLCCVPFIIPSYYEPYIPVNQGHFGHFGWSGVLSGTAFVFLFYLGFDIVAAAGPETENPRKNLPIGILGTLSCCALLAALFSGAMVGVVPYLNLAEDSHPLATAMHVLNMPVIAQCLNLAILVGFLAGLYGIIFGQSRILSHISDEGLLPAVFAQKNSRHAPWFAILFLSIIAAVLAVFLPLKALGNVISLGALLTFLMVCLAFIILRIRMPDHPRPFQVFGGNYFVPMIGIVSCVVGTFTIDFISWLYLGIWLLLGFAVYLFYGRRKSKMRNENVL
ncbi:amino acid permease [Acetobacteraceae bacterium]|nr:amino acid permease [Acetobacteraceae bacterium]